MGTHHMYAVNRKFFMITLLLNNTLDLSAENPKAAPIGRYKRIEVCRRFRGINCPRKVGRVLEAYKAAPGDMFLASLPPDTDQYSYPEL